MPRRVQSVRPAQNESPENVNVFLYAVTVFAWGLSWYAVQMQLGVVSPEVSVFYRFAISAAVMALFCLVTRRRMDFTARDHLSIAAQGLFLFGMNFYLVYRGSQFLPSGLVSILFSMLVVMNMIGGALFLKNPVDQKVIVSAAFGIAGIVSVFWRDLAGFDLDRARMRDTMTGIALVLSGTLSASNGMMISAANQRRGPGVVRTNTLGMAYGAPFFLVFCVARGAEFTVDWSARYLGSLMFLSLVSTVIAFATYLTLAGRIGPERAAYASVVFPLVALAVSTWAEGFQWTGGAIAGVMLVLAGNLFVLTKSPPAARPENPAAKGDA
ncbi:MAG: DMT family transporter [Rhodospirillaceae bacterium]